MIVRRIDFILQQRAFAGVEDIEKHVEKMAQDPAKVAEQQAKLAQAKGIVSTELSPMQKRQVEKMSGKGYTHKFENGKLSFFDQAGKEAQYAEVFKSSKAITPVAKKPKPETSTVTPPAEAKADIVKSTPTEITSQQPNSQSPQQKPKRRKKKTQPGGGNPPTPQQPVNPNPQGGTWTSSSTPSPQTPPATNTVTNNLQKNKGFFGKMTKNQKIMGGLALGAAGMGAGLYAYQKHKNKKNL